MRKGNIKPIWYRDDIAFLLFRQRAHLTQHVVDKYSVPRGGVVDQDMGDRTDELAVLDQGGARQECGQEGTTKFPKIIQTSPY